jgi:hypothetical protein
LKYRTDHISDAATTVVPLLQIIILICNIIRTIRQYKLSPNADYDYKFLYYSEVLYQPGMMDDDDDECGTVIINPK